MGSAGKVAIGVLGIAVAVVLFLLLSSDDAGDEDSTTTAPSVTTTESQAEDAQGSGDSKPDEPKPEEAEPEVPVIEVENGQPVGGVQKLSFKAGDDIRFVVTSDVAEEIHFHGYDVAEDVEAGGKVGFDVPATIEGVFEVELEHSAVPIAEISVNPA
jgi:hypothetical protein